MQSQNHLSTKRRLSGQQGHQSRIKFIFTYQGLKEIKIIEAQD